MTFLQRNSHVSRVYSLNFKFRLFHNIDCFVSSYNSFDKLTPWVNNSRFSQY